MRCNSFMIPFTWEVSCALDPAADADPEADPEADPDAACSSRGR